MPSIEYFLVCRSVQRDVNTDEYSFLNILEDISPDSFPHTIHKAVAVSLWNFEPTENEQDYQAMLVVKLPNQNQAMFPMNFTKEAHRFRAIQGILEIPVEVDGDVVFEVSLNGVHAATHTIRVHATGLLEPTIGMERLTP